MMDSLEQSLAELRVELSPSAADKARLRARILEPAIGAGVSAAPRTRWAALKATGSAGLASGAMLLGLGLGAGFWLGREASAPVASPPDLPAALEPAPAPPGEASALSAAPSPAPPVIPASEPTADAPRDPAPTSVAANSGRAPEPRRSLARSHARRASPSPLNDELALLRRIERALRNGDPALALALLGELDERFPETRLVEERQAARLLAGCRLNDPMAIARAHAFLHDNPASVYRQRVQLACEGGATSPQQHVDTPLKDAAGSGH